MRWLLAFGRLAFRLILDYFHRESSYKQLGIRLRQLFVEMGGAAVKIGQQLSVRIDILPYAVCHELEQLVDNVPSFPVEQAIERIEYAAGMRAGGVRVPLDRIFESFDPHAIGSASIACVYQAILHSGERVAVKVRRPGIVAAIAADLGVIVAATRALEILAFFRSGFFENLRSELNTMLAEELDFWTEGRYQRLFRYYARRDKLKWVTAPRVFTRYCSQDVLVTEFVTGFTCTEILAAYENNDHQALSELKSRGITPKKVGKRLMEYSFWSRYEALIFHADPHHGNIMLQDECKLVFLDFGSCGTTSRGSRMNQLIIMDRMSHNDISGSVEAGIATLEPLPLLDVYNLRKSLEAEFSRWLFAFRDKKSEWWERTTAGLWLALLSETRKRHIPVGLETVRLARSLLLIDTLCFRLYPKMVSPDAFVKYERNAMRRGARKVIRRLENTPLSYYPNTLITEGNHLLSRVRYVAWQAERFADSIPKDFVSTLSKLSLFATEVLRVLRIAALGFLAIYLYALLYPNGVTVWARVWGIVTKLATSPIAIGVVMILGYRYYRHIGFRVRDFDVERRWPWR